MKNPSRRGRAATTCALAIAASAALVPTVSAHAAGTNSAFALTAPELSSAQVGQAIELRVTPTTGDLDCDSLTLQQKVGSSWVDVTHDAEKSGCWTGGANFVTTITSGMAKGGLRLYGRGTGVTSAPLGSVAIGADATASETAVELVDHTASDIPTTFGWQVGLAEVPKEAVGQDVALRITAQRGANIDCSSIALQRQDTDGDWQNVALDYESSGCWDGGAVLQAKVTAKMGGHALRLTGKATRSGSEDPSLVGQTMALGQTDIAPVTATSKDTPAATPVPEKDQTKVDSPLANAPAPEVTPDLGNTTDGGNGSIAELDLPRVPWEGGASYYKAYSDAANGGWTDPKHFPIAVWWGGYSSDADIQKDKKLGINTYVQLNHVADWTALKRNGMSLIGNQLDGQPRHDSGWVGDYLDDEVDGRFGAAEGQAVLQSEVDKVPDHDKFRYANFTGMVISWYQGHPDWDANASKYVRDYTDVLSLDSYWYSSDACDWDDPNGSGWAVPFTKKNCRTGQNYGRNVEGMRIRLNRAGSVQPVMNFIEIVEPAEKGYTTHPLTTDEVKGAAMSSIIHEARGLVWFNQAFHGRCATGNAVRSYYDESYPCRSTVAAAGEVNNLIQSLAPVLNTQSYQWSFGKDIDAMLKVHDGSAYVFAMADDSYSPGSRTFTLPKAMQGKTVQVVGENRTISPNANGTFTDSFANVNSYHVYKIS